MGITNYYTIDGGLAGERAGNGASVDYLRDGLGSITGTSDSDGTVVNTYRHKPFGEQLAKSGAGADPGFLWGGTAGYRRTDLEKASHYVRARHYDQGNGAWTTVDPLWPNEPSYVYSRSSPTNYLDYYGLIPIIPSDSGCGSQMDGLLNCCKDFNDKMVVDGKLDGAKIKDIMACMALKHYDTAAHQAFILGALKHNMDMCKSGGSASFSACIYCEWGGTLPKGCNCKPPEGKKPPGAFTPIPSNIRPIPLNDTGCTVGYQDDTHPCWSLRKEKVCECAIIFCTPDWGSPAGACGALFHEMRHCGGAGNPPGHNDIKAHDDIIYALGCCLCEALNGKGSPSCFECKFWG